MKHLAKNMVMPILLTVIILLIAVLCVPQGVVEADEGKITVIPILKDGKVTYTIENLGERKESDIFNKIEVTTDDNIKVFGGKTNYYTTGEVKPEFKAEVVFGSATIDMPANGIAIFLMVASFVIFVIMIVASFIAFGDKTKRNERRKARSMKKEELK